jgi:hypothetical protein
VNAGTEGPRPATTSRRDRGPMPRLRPSPFSIARRVWRYGVTAFGVQRSPATNSPPTGPCGTAALPQGPEGGDPPETAGSVPATGSGKTACGSRGMSGVGGRPFSATSPRVIRPAALAERPARPGRITVRLQADRRIAGAAARTCRRRVGLAVYLLHRDLNRLERGGRRRTLNPHLRRQDRGSQPLLEFIRTSAFRPVVKRI